ncbi:Uncharacterised protein [uncultured archaeon]|nr:Uncharacterised protein [uncultured archaeon]
MKGINVKKLAAIATGAALLGSAVAPIVYAAVIQKTDIYNDDGTPKVNIVVGAKAALSDAVWAGNLAAKIAEKAAVQKDVTVAAGSGTGGTATGSIDLNGLTVDVTVGGTVSYGAGSKQYIVNLSSAEATSGDNTSEVLTAMDSSDSNALTTQLPHLVNKTITVKVNNGNQSSQTTSLSIKEMVGVNVDAKFTGASDSTTKDLVAKIGSGKFSYKTTIGSSTTGLTLGSTSFTDDGTSNVKVVFFGEEYKLNKATLTSGSKYVKLVKTTAKETLTEGQEVEGLVGENLYAGKTMKVKFQQLSATSATATYKGTFNLYDPEGNLVSTQTVLAGSNLRDVFLDSAGNTALQTNLFVDTIANASTTNLGYAEITKGTDTVELYDGKEYPYDSTKATTTKRYVAYITPGSADANSLYSVEIRNSAEVWSTATNDGYDFGPLYPTDTTQSLTGHAATTATFGQGWTDGILGKNYVSVEFAGFENKQSKASVTIGKIAGLPSGTNGGLTFRGDNDAVRTVPFYIKLNDYNTTWGNFDFEGKPIYYNLRYGASKTGTYDYNVTVHSGDVVNGRAWTLSAPDDSNMQLSIDGVGPIKQFAQGAVWDTNVFSVDGVSYKVEDANVADATSRTMVISVDAAAEFRLNNETGTQLYGTTGNVAADQVYGTMLLSNNSPFDANATLNLPVYTQDSSRPVYYAVKYNTTAQKLFLMLDAQRFGAGASNKIKDSHGVAFLGTYVPADDGTYTEVEGFGTAPYGVGVGFAYDTNRGNDLNLDFGTQKTMIGSSGFVFGHYVPKDSDYNNSTQNSGVYTSSNAYFVAQFAVDDAATSGTTWDFNAFIDAGTGGNIGPFGSSVSNLSGFSYDVKYSANTSWNLQSGSESTYLKAGYSDTGAKASLLDADAGALFSLPQASEKVLIVVKGKDVTREVAGDDILGIPVGDTKESAGGTKITVKAVKGGSCKVSTVKGEPGACTADPETYRAQAPVQNPLVFLDTESPTGTNIVVGGQIVNSLAASLADRLTTAGQKVVEVDASGNVIVAGYTAQDTVAAVKELIDAIDGFA